MNAMSHPFSIGSRIAAFCLLAALLLSTSACDSEDTFDTEQLFGRYTFDAFVLEPDAQLPNTDLLEELASVELEFFRGGEFSLRYRFPDQTGAINAGGTFSTGADDVRLTVNNPGNHANLFLPETFRLTIEEEGDRLTRDIRRLSLNLDDTRYERYDGIRDADGTLTMQLTRVE
jgi:hypothetical protein